jgi:hypothetical protein
METREQVEARLRMEYPHFTVSEGDVSYNIYPDELPEIYEEMLSDRVQSVLDAQEASAIEQAKVGKTAQFSSGMKTLRDNLIFLNNLKNPDGTLKRNLTPAELHKGMSDNTRSLIWLGEVLRDYGVFTWDDL